MTLNMNNKNISPSVETFFVDCARVFFLLTNCLLYLLRILFTGVFDVHIHLEEPVFL